MIDKIRFQKIYTALLIAALFFMVGRVHAEAPKFYTIQTGSFTKFKTAKKHYDALMLGLVGLDESALDYLRIEKIGEYHAVRVGRFTNYMSAQEFLQATRVQLSGAIILKATLNEERIVELYGEGPAVEVTVTTDVSMPSAEVVKPVEPQPRKTPEDVVASEAEELQVSYKPKPDDEQGLLSTIRGKFYVSDYYSTDSGDYNFHVLTSRLNFYKREEEKAGYYFEFDGKVRKKIINGALRGNVPKYKIDEAWVGYKFPGEHFRIIAGRQYIQELYNTDIDGLNVKYTFEKGLGIGVFGGFAPDKFDDNFNDQYKSIGLYGFLNNNDHQLNVGYEYLTYGGQPDREYFSARANSKINQKVRVNALTSVSKNQLTNNYEMENANATVTYSHSKQLRFNVFANYYRSIKYYESSKYYFEFADVNDNFLLDNNSQTRVGGRVDYKIAKGLKVYGSTAYQKKKLDNEHSTRITAGIRKYDFYGFDLSGRYTFIDNYSSRDNEYNVEIFRTIMNKFDVTMYASYEETKLDLENAFTDGSRTYGTSLYWPITRKLYLSTFLEYIDEDDYSSVSLFTQLGYKFKP